MDRQNIILGNYTYVVDRYTAYKDFIPSVKNFAIIRDITIINDVSYDKSVYFIEKDIIDLCKDKTGKIDIAKLSKQIVYPITNIDSPSFSNDIKNFSSDISNNQLIDGIDINALYDNSYVNYSDIPCDKIRIYTPVLNPKLNAIICVYNYINNVHFYYFCKTLENYSTKSETEFTEYGCNYSQFYEIEIPNVEYLFTQGTNYISENFNISSVKSSIKYIPQQKHESANEVLNNYIQFISKLTPELVDVSNGKTLKNVIKFYIVTNGINSLYCNFLNNNFYITGYNYFITKDELNKCKKTFEQFKSDIQDLNKDYVLSFTHTETVNTYAFTIYAVTQNINADAIKFGSYVVVEREKPNVLNIDIFSKYDIDNSTNSIDVSLGLFENKTVKNVQNYTLDTKWIKTINEKNDKDLLIDLYTLSLPFSIEPCVYNDVVSYEKIFMDTSIMTQNSISNNLTICIYPYTSINETTNLYVPDSDYIYNADIFTDDNTFNLAASFSFSDEYAVINTKFNYTKRNEFTSLFDEYCARLNITKDTYKNWNDVNEEMDLDIDTNIEKVGYRIEIANDIAFNHIIHVAENNIDVNDDFFNFIDDFQFTLNDIFTSWDNLPEMLVCRTIFIDKVTMTILYSNILLITREQYKYLIQEGIHKIKEFKDLQHNIVEHKKFSKKSYMEKFNFIDKITCVVNKSEVASDAVAKNISTAKIIYKPIFFKVADLQTIRIRRGLKQNIGVNLSDLMTKVEAFKMIINGEEIIESGRSDVYVLFNINAANFTTTTGLYTIVNQDDEYLSDGSWNIY